MPPRAPALLCDRVGPISSTIAQAPLSALSAERVRLTFQERTWESESPAAKEWRRLRPDSQSVPDDLTALPRGLPGVSAWVVWHRCGPAAASDQDSRSERLFCACSFRHQVRRQLRCRRAVDVRVATNPERRACCADL